MLNTDLDLNNVSNDDIQTSTYLLYYSLMNIADKGQEIVV
jgi:hypothetical protein